MEKKKPGRKPTLFKVEGFSFEEALGMTFDAPPKKKQPKKKKKKQEKK